MNFIEPKANVMVGKPVIAGTRITVECILESLDAGETIEQIVAEHPRLTREDVLAAIEFAASALRADVVYPVAGHAHICTQEEANSDVHQREKDSGGKCRFSA